MFKSIEVPMPYQHWSDKLKKLVAISHFCAPFASAIWNTTTKIPSAFMAVWNTSFLYVGVYVFCGLMYCVSCPLCIVVMHTCSFVEQVCRPSYVSVFDGLRAVLRDSSQLYNVVINRILFGENKSVSKEPDDGSEADTLPKVSFWRRLYNWIVVKSPCFDVRKFVEELKERCPIKGQHVEECLKMFDLATWYKHFVLFRKSEIFHNIVRLLNMIVTVGWVKEIEYTWRGILIFRASCLRAAVSVTDIFDLVIELVTQIVSAFLKCISGQGISAFYADVQKSTYDDQYTMLVAKFPLLEAGKLDIDVHMYGRILEELTTQTKELLNVCKAGERTYYSIRLEKLKKIQTAMILAQKKNVRKKPFGILLYGGSSVGKSSIANSLVRYVLGVNGFDNDPNSIVTLNEFDKFQSEYRSYHGGVIFDDLANGTVETTDGNPLMKVIQFLNNVPMAALNPNVELKGNIMIEPNVVVGTTNVKDLSAPHYSQEPVSVLRRFDLIVTQTVKPEFVRKGTQMLDPAKAKVFRDKQFPDYALFTVEEAIQQELAEGVNIKPSVKFRTLMFEGKPMVNVPIETLVDFLRSRSKDHFGEQDTFVQSQKNLENFEICECGKPADMCTECALDSQWGLMPDFSRYKEFLLSKEELVCQFIEKYIRKFWRTSIGEMFLLYLMRDQLTRCFRVFIVCYAFFLLSLGVLDAYLQLNLFVWLIPILACTFVACKFFVSYKRWRFIKKYSTIPRPSALLAKMSWRDKCKLLKVFGGIVSVKIIFKMIDKWGRLPTAQASAAISIPSEGKVYKPEFWDRASSQESAPVVPTTHESSCMTVEQMRGVISKRLAFLKVDSDDKTSKFCNCFPLKSNIHLIPNHVVPSKPQKVTLRRVNTNSIKLTLSPASTYRIPGTDYALWYLPEAGDQRDIMHWFPDETPPTKHIEGFLVYNDGEQFKQYAGMVCKNVPCLTTKGGRFPAYQYTFPGETFDGLCMAPLIGRGPNTFLAGFHLAGKGSHGAAGILTRPMVMDAIGEMMKSRNAMLESHSAQDMWTENMGVSIGPLKAPHVQSAVYSVPADAKMKVFGDHVLPRATARSTVIPSIISPHVEEVMSIPRQHGRPYKMADKMHHEVDIANKSDCVHAFDHELCEKAYKDFFSSIMNYVNKNDRLKKVGKIGKDAVFAGIDGVDGINAMQFTTSAGFPLKGKKDAYSDLSERAVEGISCPRDVEPLILDEIERMRSVLSTGQRCNTVFKASLKDEPTKLTKKKVRVFASCNFPFVALTREYFLSLSKLMQDHKDVFECAVGINVESPEWTTFMKGVYRYGKDRIVAGDYKSFDGRMSARFMLMAFKILIEIAEASGNYDAEDITVMKGIATEICGPNYDFFGTLVQFYGSNPSGHPLTVVINSLVNSLYMRYCYFSIARKEKWLRVPKFQDVVSLMTYGDDNIMSVRKGFDSINHTGFASELAECGIIYTMPDKEAESVPYIHASEASFLKHYAEWDDELELYRARIEEGSVAKMLHAHLTSEVLPKEMSSAEAINNVLRKYFHFGREVFAERRQQLSEVARRAGLLGYVGELPDYDELLMNYRLKYDWQVVEREDE